MKFYTKQIARCDYNFKQKNQSISEDSKVNSNLKSATKIQEQQGKSPL